MDFVKILNPRLESHLQAISPVEKTSLLEEFKDIDFKKIHDIFHRSMAPSSKQDSRQFRPPQLVSAVETRKESDVAQWWTNGLRLIGEGKLAVLLLAGGQGTRLGSSAPKGCFDIGLPSKKSLFQIQAERLARVQSLASAAQGGRPALVPWYIMTSTFTHKETVQYFKQNSFFGLSESQVTFFEQSLLPCFSLEGELLLESNGKLCKAPDGNGGVYAALKRSGSFQEMRDQGIQFVECFSVDNSLVRVADPLFLGYFQETSSPCGAKVVQKAYPEERVGVFVQKGSDGPIEVVEYSELDADMAHSVDPETGKLRFLWSNVCMHLFTVDFLETAISSLEAASTFHVAKKNIPTIDGVVPGVKLEQFIFDAFQFSKRVSLFEVHRSEEFSPVKNAPGTDIDSPDSARRHVLTLHRKWVERAGGMMVSHKEKNTGEIGLEVSPLVSYLGEGLESICGGRMFEEGTEIY